MQGFPSVELRFFLAQAPSEAAAASWLPVLQARPWLPASHTSPPALHLLCARLGARSTRPLPQAALAPFA